MGNNLCQDKKTVSREITNVHNYQVTYLPNAKAVKFYQQQKPKTCLDRTMLIHGLCKTTWSIWEMFSKMLQVYLTGTDGQVESKK